MEKDPCRGAVYLIVLCDHPSLFSVLFAVLLSLLLLQFKCFSLVVVLLIYTIIAPQRKIINVKFHVHSLTN